MSTRATYRFLHDDFRVTMYIHCDGYPFGASQYLKKALEHRTSPHRGTNASLADDFIKANDRAELTKSHEFHTDRAYQYTISTTGDYRFGPFEILVKAEMVTGDRLIDTELVFRGTLQEFIDQEQANETKRVLAADANRREALQAQRK